MRYQVCTVLDLCTPFTHQHIWSADILVVKSMKSQESIKITSGKHSNDFTCFRDYGYVGCEANVMAHMDSRCSGRRSCEIRIPDVTLDRANPCPKDFKTYLHASYGCVKGIVLFSFLITR